MMPMKVSCTIIVIVSQLIVAEAQAKVVAVDGPRVTLRDLLGEGVANADLGPAPRPGFRRRIERRHVRALLGSKRRLPGFWIVQTRKQIVDCDRLTRMTKTALAGQLAPGLTMKSLRCARALVMPRGSLRLVARLAAGVRRAGQVSVRADISAGTWPTRRVLMSARVDGMVNVLIARRAISSREGLNPAALGTERRLASSLPRDAVKNLGAVAGYRLRASLPAGAIVRRVHLAAVPVVARGSAVTITVQMNGIRLTNRGVARADGPLGALIPISCPRSGRIIRARVVGRQRVVIDL